MAATEQNIYVVGRATGDTNVCRILLSQPDAFRPVACYGSDVEGEGGWVDEGSTS